ncbi:MAG: Formyl-CoA transferase [Ilumatobacteraceae bacterium]|nr:Formyl-CoA transferase [Ilumatobacteraceae bacterium]
MSDSGSADGSESPLSGLVVVDLSSGIPGAYCTKLLAGAGATVVKLEAPDGDPLRRSSTNDTGDDGVLFEYLACSKESVVIDPDDPSGMSDALELIGRAQVVVWSSGSSLSTNDRLTPAVLREAFPTLVVSAISPFGLDGPWAHRAATEFTLQAWAGAIGHRGLPGHQPVAVGGRVGEWAAGMYSAVAVLAALRRAERSGRGELLDTSVLDAVALTLTNMHPVTFFAEAGFARDPSPNSLVPGIHPTSDGWVGFMTGTGQQWLDFCVLIERFDWMDEPDLIRAQTRSARRSEITDCINAWTSGRTTAEVIEFAAELRIPVAPVATGETAPLINPSMYEPSPTGRFVQPKTPYILGDGAQLRVAGPPPKLGEHTARHTKLVKQPDASFPRVRVFGDGPPLDEPFAGVRIVDLTAFWAGPSTTQAFATLGADVIKVESPVRPDGLRAVSTLPLSQDLWWEHAPLFHATNTNKRSLGLRLDRPRGIAVLRELLDSSDVLIENFSPRVLDSWGLDYESLSRSNPRLIVVRMPAFGLAGEWRNRTGFAQTMEQMSGMAWITGYPDTGPIVPNGPCDPIAGGHAAFALEVALAQRERTGRGMLVEVPMVMSALNVAAEMVIEYSANGVRIERTGNHGRGVVVQNLYRTSEDDDGIGGPLVAIAVENGEQWVRIVETAGWDDWNDSAAPGSNPTTAQIDTRLESWCSVRTSDEIISLLWSADVPVAKVLMPHQPDRTQFDARHFFEEVIDPLSGASLIPGLPVRFSAGPHHHNRLPSPLLGQHNLEVLRDILGYEAGHIALLESDGTVGRGMHAESKLIGLD